MTADLDIEPVARRLLGKPTSATMTELRYGNGGSLSVDLVKNTYFDFQAGSGGGVLDLVRRQIGGSRREARAWMRDELGVCNTPDRKSVSRPREKTPAERQAEALAICEASAPIQHTPGEEYLQCRGIMIQAPACIRSHAGKNALVAIVQARGGTFTGIQRIYLTTDTRGTWHTGKRSLGPVKGGAVWLTPAAASIQLTESVEDGLALFQLTRRPTWAVPGAGFMESFEPPPEVREVILAPDHDAAGLKAIERAHAKLRDRVKVRQLLPPKGLDWCDTLEACDERIAIQEEPVTPARSWAEEFCDG